MIKLITMSELHEMKTRAKNIFENDAEAATAIKELEERISKGGRYLADLRDQADPADPSPALDGKIEKADQKLLTLQADLKARRLKYELPYRALTALYELAAYTTKLGLTRSVPGPQEGLHNALQIRMEDIDLELLLDLSYDGIPF